MRVVVIGAGIVGLHVAHPFRERGDEVWVLERNATLGEETSGRNSGVIHAGIFYEAGSLKERTCLEGNRLTYEWCERLGVSHRPCGKWVVPEEGQEGEIGEFFEKVRGLPIVVRRPRKADGGPETAIPILVSPEKLREVETSLRPSEAIFIPTTGIVDAAGYVKGLARFLESAGVQIIPNCKVTRAARRLETSRGPIDFDLAINCAGLYADEIAQQAGVGDYEIRPCRGDYYLLHGQPIPRPVYHLPYRGAAGLGVHLTPTLDGQTLLGPNAFFIEGKGGYAHRSAPAPYEAAVRFYLPSLEKPRLSVAYSGNRPKLYKAGRPLSDFVIEKRDNWIHLLGIESPGLTAAPALAKEVMSLA